MGLGSASNEGISLNIDRRVFAIGVIVAGWLALIAFIWGVIATEGMLLACVLLLGFIAMILFICVVLSKLIYEKLTRTKHRIDY